MLALGLDTSCYTTSAALCQSGMAPQQARQLLPVPAGERGLRQSEAVFAHVRQMPMVMDDLKEQLKGIDHEIVAVCASSSPRDEEDSYMPVFTVGLGHAEGDVAVSGCEVKGSIEGFDDGCDVCCQTVLCHQLVRR